MQNEINVRDKLYADFAGNYMEKIFYFCLKKTGNEHEAEDLTQDIALCILSSLHGGTIPRNFSAWVWQIARNRYASWSDSKRRRRESLSNSDIGDFEIEDENGNILDEMIHSDDLSLLRRELAFIKREYRDIIVAYYIENKTMRQIASSVSVSLDTVKKRLQRARIILKEGMNMAREFGTRSYKPEEISFTNNCSAFGSKGQPWSILTHALYKNIFLEAYGNPSTAEELAYELGVALPYMEDELEFLTRETFLVKRGNKYETDFPIVSKQVQEDIFAYQMSFAGKLTSLLETLIDEYSEICASHGLKFYGSHLGYEDAKWTLLMHTFDKIVESLYKYKSSRTERPDGGRWDIVGYQAANIAEPPFVGLHGCLDDPESDTFVYFQQYKFRHKGICDLTPKYLTGKEAAVLLKIARNDHADCDKRVIGKLIEYGYVRERANGFEPAIVIFDKNSAREYESHFTDDEKDRIESLANEIRKILADAHDYSCERNLADIPEYLMNNEKIRAFASTYSHFDRGIVLEQAISDGWLIFDDNTEKTIGAFLYI